MHRVTIPIRIHVSAKNNLVSVSELRLRKKIIIVEAIPYLFVFLPNSFVVSAPAYMVSVQVSYFVQQVPTIVCLKLAFGLGNNMMVRFAGLPKVFGLTRLLT